MNNERRLRFHQVLATVLTNFENKIYFRPSSKMVLTYPCVVYNDDKSNYKKSNGRLYTNWTTFKVTVIIPAPGFFDSSLILDIPHSKFVTHYQSNDLVHYVYEINYA